MKLPTFQAQQGTSMGSAMTSPAQVGQAKMRIAEVRPLVGVRDVQGELRLGIAKSNRNLLIGKSVVDASATFMKIKQTTDDANNTAAQKLASAERTNFAASLTTQLKIDANVLDDDGNRGFETAETKYAEHMKAYDEQARNERRFSGAKAESAWSIGKTTEDRVYTDAIKVWSVDAKNEQTKAMNEAALLQTRDPEAAKEILAGEVKAGLETEGGMQQRLIDWSSNIVQTDIIIGTDMLKQQAPTMQPDDFNTMADALSQSVLDSDYMSTPEMKRKMLGDISALRTDYEENQRGNTQDSNSALYSRAYTEAVIKGKHKQIEQLEKLIMAPDAQSTYGDNFMALNKMVNTRGEANTSSREALDNMTRVIEEIRDLETTPKFAQSILETYYDQLSTSAYNAFMGQVHTAYNTELGRARQQAKYWSNMLIVGVADPAELPSEQLIQTSRLRGKAAIIQGEILDALDAWESSPSGMPAPDPRKMVTQKWAEKFYVDTSFMMNASGNAATDLWDINLSKTQEMVNDTYAQKFALDPEGEVFHAYDRGERNRLIEQIKNMQDAVPTRPEKRQ